MPCNEITKISSVWVVAKSLDFLLTRTLVYLLTFHSPHLLTIHNHKAHLELSFEY